MMMTPTRHEKGEWARLARDAISTHRTSYARVFAAASRLRDDEQMTIQYFDALQSTYRAWLLGEWKPVTSCQ